jgi:hypothetical protein
VGLGSAGAGVLKDPAQPAVLVQLTEARNRFVLLKSDDLSIAANGEPIKLAICMHARSACMSIACDEGRPWRPSASSRTKELTISPGSELR